MERLICEALAVPFVVISIDGPHAGQSQQAVHANKGSEIQSAIKRIFWYTGSYTCPVSDVYDLVSANGNRPTYVLYVGRGSQTKTNDTARFCADTRLRPMYETSREWKPIPAGITVTGTMDRRAKALALQEYVPNINGVRVDLGQYTFFNPEYLNLKPGRGQTIPSLTHQGRSTVCAKKGSHGARTDFRRLVGVGVLGKPYAVWLR